MRTTTSTRGLFVIGLLLLLSMSTGQASAATFKEDFNGSSLDPSLVVFGSPGFAMSLAGGKAVLTKTAGTGSGYARITSTFAAVGDFTATVSARRTTLLGLSEMGIATNQELGFTDVYFADMDRIVANINVSPGFGYKLSYDSTTQVTFRIRRVGNTLFEEVDTGSGFAVLHSASHTNLASPARLSLFLIQGYGSTNAHAGEFDDWTITAKQFLPCVGSFTPYGSGLSGAGGLVPTLTGGGCPFPGLPLSLDIKQAVGGAPVLFLVGFAPGSFSYNGGSLLVAPPWLSLLFSIGGSPGVPGAGSVSLPAVLPAELALFGLDIYAQVIVADSAAMHGTSLTNGLQITLGEF